MSPRPDKEYLMWLYKNHFWEMKSTKGTFGINVLKHPSLLLHRFLNRGLKERIKKQTSNATGIIDFLSSNYPIGPDTHILEIGSSFGETLRLLNKKYQCSVLGVEPSKKAANFALKNNINTIQAFAEDIPNCVKDTSAFDIIIISHVLENICHPISFLGEIKTILAPTGVLFINTPNFYYQDSRNPFHNYIFSPETLKTMLGLCEFKILSSNIESGQTHNNLIHFSVLAQWEPGYKPPSEQPDAAAMLDNRIKGIPRYTSHRLLNL